MAPFQRPNRLFLLVIFCFSTVLAACSSGGGKGHSSPAPSDSRPDSFVITAPDGVSLENVPFNTPITSAPVTIEGIDTAAPVSITDGEFRINNGTFASTNATVRNGETITVRVQSPVKAGKSATATLNVGGVTASFTVTTGPDTTPPEVTILFPPPASMTEGETLFVRGSVKDVHGTLKAEDAVLVNGIAATLEPNSTGDEASWSVTLPLELGENEIVVTAEDAASNKNEDESVASRRVESIAGESFPDEVNPFFSAFKADIGLFNGELTAFVTDDSRARPGVVAVDLATGLRTVVADNQGVQESLRFDEPQAVHVGSNGKLYVSDYSTAIFEIDPVNLSRRKIAAEAEDSFLYRPKGMFLNENQLYVADTNRIYWVDISTLDQTIFSGAAESLPNAQTPFDNIWGLVSYPDRFYVSEWGARIVSVDRAIGGRQVFVELESEDGVAVDILKNHKTNELIYLANGVGEAAVYRVNLMSKVSNVISSSDVPDNKNIPVEVWGIAGHKDIGFLLLIDRDQRAVMAVDLEKGFRVVLSKSVISQ